MSTTTVTVNQDVREKLRQQAAAFRERRTEEGTLVVNLVSSPGAGKTSLLQATAEYWGADRKMAVLVGDLATDRDAQRLAPLVPVRQLTTGGACHLEIPLVQREYDELQTEKLDFLFIENIGNLVCPASHDLGEHLRVVLLSTTEGDDKPGKYPKMFRTSQAMAISKVDLLPYLPFDCESAIQDARQIQPDIHACQVSVMNGDGIGAWCEYLDDKHAEMVSQRVHTS